MLDPIMDDDTPCRVGWYIVYVFIPEGGWLEPRFWNGEKWHGDAFDRIGHVYYRRFQTEAEAEIYGGKDLY